MATVYVASREQQQQKSNLIVTVTRDLATVITFGVLLLCLHELASPFVRGFHCDDDTIRYPFKDSTVSSGVCYFTGSGINVLLILLVEYVVLANEDGFQIKVYLGNVYCRLMVWFFGSITSELLTDISKVTAGRLRPHFIDVCKPRVLTASGGEISLDQYCSAADNQYRYITSYICSGDPSKQRESRLSFLSGHSSYSTYSAAHAVYYIQSRVGTARLGLLKPSLQVLIVSAAFYTALTRVSDYKHHWQDVLAGIISGTAVATYVSTLVWPSFYRSYSKFFKTPNPTVQPGEELNRFAY